jgi:hypothetical protein
VQSEDPAVVDTLVVHTDDVVTALEANARRDAGAVLRVTPPFSGRMRARLHLAGREADYGEPRPIHVDPATLVPGVAPFPHPDDTAERVRDGGDYSVDDHRDEHAEAVAAWRAAVRERLAERATVETAAGPQELTVTPLG